MSILSKKDEPKAEASPVPAPAPAPLPPPAIDPKTGKLPPGAHKRRWGQKEYPSKDFIRVTYLVTGSLSGQRFAQGKTGDVPKEVFEGTLKPGKMARLWEKPKVIPQAARPASDVGNFRRQ